MANANEEYINNNEEYLDNLVKRFRGFKSPNDTQKLIVLLGEKDNRNDEDTLHYYSSFALAMLIPFLLVVLWLG